MICESCGKEIKELYINFFLNDGDDRFYLIPISECENNAVYVDIDTSWTGYDLEEKEQQETIECPFCKKFPFKSKEIQTHEIVRAVFFKQNGEEYSIEELLK